MAMDRNIEALGYGDPLAILEANVSERVREQDRAKPLACAVRLCVCPVGKLGLTNPDNSDSDSDNNSDNSNSNNYANASAIRTRRI